MKVVLFQLGTRHVRVKSKSFCSSPSSLSGSALQSLESSFEPSFIVSSSIASVLLSSAPDRQSAAECGAEATGHGEGAPAEGALV